MLQSPHRLHAHPKPRLSRLGLSDLLMAAAWGIALLALIGSSTGCQQGSFGISDQNTTEFADRANETGLFPSTDVQPVTGQAIYGGDDRREPFEVPLRERSWSEATVALVQQDDIYNAGGVSFLLSEPLGRAERLCSDQRFVDQPTAAFCSGFLVAPDLVITAGHCVDSGSCTQTRFVFGYRQRSTRQSASTVRSDDIYSCRSLLAREDRPSSDFAVVQLDRPVRGRKPLALRRSGQVVAGAPLTLIGYPSGLPVKIAQGGVVLPQSQPQGGRFLASVDAFAGNSGSAVIHSTSGEVEGILVAGEPDYISRGSCNVAAVCGSSCRGEAVTPIAQVLAWVPTSR